MNTSWVIRKVAEHSVRFMESRLPTAEEHFLGIRHKEPDSPPSLVPDALRLVAEKLDSPRDIAAFASVSRDTRLRSKQPGISLKFAQPCCTT